MFPSERLKNTTATVSIGKLISGTKQGGLVCNLNVVWDLCVLKGE